MNEFQNLIEFKILNPQSIIRIWYPEFDIKSLIVGAKKQLEFSKDERESILDEIFIFVFISVVVLIFIILGLVASLLFKGLSLGNIIKEKLIDFKEKFFFNGMIKSFSVSFLKLGIASSIQIMMLINTSPYLKPKEKRNSLIIFSGLLLSIFILYFFIWYHKDVLDTKAFKDKFGALHKGIHIRRMKSNIYYFPIFLLRRFLFFLIPVVMINYPAQ
jgi:hypothetical protein